MGNYRKRVGIIGASKIGRHVIRLLAPYELDVVVADPYLDAAEAAAIGVELVTLDELVASSDVVSLHAPSLPSTKNLIDAGRIEGLRPGATFINTSRGDLVDQGALLARVERGDIYAVLDVTTPWVLPADSGFYAHPNVLLTPHIAGSLGNELERMAASTVQEALRLSRAPPLVSRPRRRSRHHRLVLKSVHFVPRRPGRLWHVHHTCLGATPCHHRSHAERFSRPQARYPLQPLSARCLPKIPGRHQCRAPRTSPRCGPAGWTRSPAAR
ncbi:D-3-phosphoglycerate dehydrogenase [Arthrobacter sp. Hiyo8]|nr:D-3-phosphoglycerate dehydrogenase [Arthrobacter sp. Hiyo8]